VLSQKYRAAKVLTTPRRFSLNLLNNNLGKETSYRSSKLLESSSEVLAMGSLFREVYLSVCGNVTGFVEYTGCIITEKE